MRNILLQMSRIQNISIRSIEKRHLRYFRQVPCCVRCRNVFLCGVRYNAETCICNRRPTTSSKSQPSRNEVTNTRASSL